MTPPLHARVGERAFREEPLPTIDPSLVPEAENDDPWQTCLADPLHSDDEILVDLAAKVKP